MIMIARTAECRASGAATARAKEGVAREAVRVGTPRTMLAVRPMAAPRPRGLPRSRKARPTIRSRCEPRSRHILLRRPAIPWPYLGPRVRAALRAAGPSAATSATKRADLEAGRIHSTSLPPLDAPRPATQWTRASRPQHTRRHTHTHTHTPAPRTLPAGHARPRAVRLRTRERSSCATPPGPPADLHQRTSTPRRGQSPSSARPWLSRTAVTTGSARARSRARAVARPRPHRSPDAAHRQHPKPTRSPLHAPPTRETRSDHEGHP
jgi:hypothetical protein